MRVVLDARMAGSTGIGRYVRLLVRHLAVEGDDLELLVAVNAGDPMAWLPPSDRVRPVCFPRRIPPFSWREQWTLPRALLRWKPDVVHAPNWNAPLRLDAPLVVTFHDLIYYHFPDSCPSRLAHWYARWALRRIAKRATHIVSVSQATADEAARELGADPARITVVHHGLPLTPSDAAAGVVGALPDGVREPFVLYVGTWAPHKNLPLLVEAVARRNAAGRPLQLVLTTPPGRHAGPVHAAIRAHRLDGAVCQLNGVDDPTLRGLYKRATALALPSRLEGFGFTPLEAFAYDCPVVASDIPTTREVAGDGALLVPVDDVAAFADALARLEDDEALRSGLRERAQARLAAFSWERTAAATADVYRDAASGGTRTTTRPAPKATPSASSPVH